MMKITLVAGLVATAIAACPESCNGHGTCGADDKCSCYDNWQGASCALRTCPYEVAWADVPIYTDGGHELAECANRGLCDRETGQCACFPGYEGKGCGRQTCPNDCSGHGTCEYIGEMASEDHPRYGAMDVTYDSWDSDHARMCKCDAGYEGADCSLRMCPRGDDALTATASDAHVQLIRLYAESSPMMQDSTATLRKGWNYEFNVTADDLWLNAAEGDRVRFGENMIPQEWSLNAYTISLLAPGNMTLEEPVWWGHEEAGVPIQLSTTSAQVTGGEFFLTYYDLYGGSWNTSAITWSGTTSTLASNVQTALRNLPLSRMASVTVSGSDGSAGHTANSDKYRHAIANSQDLLVTFAAASGQTGEQNKLVINPFVHNAAGQYPSSSGITHGLDNIVATVTTEGSSTAAFADTISEKLECGGRGHCDSTTGQCSCFDGWKGLACGTQEALV